MAITRQYSYDRTILADCALDAHAMETLRGLRRRTTMDEVTDEA
jgi:hypothetical protein